MSEESKALVRSVFEEADRNNGKIPRRLLSDEFIAHVPGSEPMDLEMFLGFLDMWYEAFSEWSHSLEDLVVEGDRVAFRYVAEAVHTGDFMGLPASGKRLTVTSVGIARIADGQVVEWWNSPDQLGFLQQLGAVPLPQAN